MNKADCERVEKIRKQYNTKKSTANPDIDFLLSIIDKQDKVVEAMKEFIRVQHGGLHEPGKLLTAYQNMQKVLGESEGAWE